MAPELKFFSDPENLRRLDRCHLTRLLQEHQDCLPREAVALLFANPPLEHENWCSAWAAQFKSPAAFGAPLINALLDIETLSLPENGTLLKDALRQLPPGYEVNRGFPPLHQALHLFLIAQNTPGVTFPIRSADCQSQNNSPTPATPTCDKSVERSEIPTGRENPQSEMNDASTFQRLASLPAAEYDRLRKAEAKRLGLRLATLDDEVDRCRDRIDEAEAAKVFLAEPEPWPEPIADPPALFDAVLGRFVAYSYLPAGAPAVFSTFMGHTHAFPAFHYTPRINILSAKETCGKSTTVKVIASMVPRPFRVQNLRPPVVYRIIDKRQPVVLLDEIETYLPLYRELLGLLNAGNSSDALVPRCEGHHIHLYKAFAPVVLAGIGDLFRTLRSRSILIHMTEAPEGVTLTRFDSQHLELEKTLAQKLARWAVDNLKAIAACDPPLPKGVRNRVADNWRPLFQIAHVVGGHWPALVTEAFHALTAAHTTLHVPGKANGQPLSTGSSSTIDHQLLLSDIRVIFAQSGSTRLFSSSIVEALRALSDRPWSAPPALNGQSIKLTEARLARELLALNVRSRRIRIAGKQARGYDLADFAQLFTRFLDRQSPDCTWSPEI